MSNYSKAEMMWVLDHMIYSLLEESKKVGKVLYPENMKKDLADATCKEFHSRWFREKSNYSFEDKIGLANMLLFSIADEVSKGADALSFYEMFSFFENSEVGSILLTKIDPSLLEDK